MAVSVYQSLMAFECVVVEERCKTNDTCCGTVSGGLEGIEYLLLKWTMDCAIWRGRRGRRGWVGGGGGE